MSIPTFDDAALTALCDLGFDYLCDRPFGEVVDVDEVLAAIDATHDPSVVTRVLQRWVTPSRERLVARAAASTLTLSVWLPEPLKDAIAAELGKPAPIPQKLIDEVVASEGVRDAVREMLREQLQSFITRVSNAGSSGSSGSSGGGGLRGAIGLGARAFGAAGKSLLGGLAEQLQDKVREFVDGSVEALQARIAKQLADPATAEALGKRRKKAFLKFLETKESKAAETVKKAPHELIQGYVPQVVAHNLARTELREAVRGEVEAVLADLGKGTVGDALDTLGLRTIARDALRTHGLVLARGFAASPEVAAWWATHVK